MRTRAICAAFLLTAAITSAAKAAPYKGAAHVAPYKSLQARQLPPGSAAQPAKPAAPPEPVLPPARFDVMPPDDQGANQTRDRLRRLLDQYPPTVRDVLRLDPSLLSRPEYLATYPALAAFLAQHPEVAHNPTFFVGDASGVRNNQGPPDSRVEAMRGWRNFVEMVPVVAIVFIITSALAGLIRTGVEQRRWQRAVRLNMDLQNKLIDRFSANNELLAYMQSPVGRGLADLQTPAGSLGMAARAMDAPLNRIFWSLQAGIVLVAAGIG